MANPTPSHTSLSASLIKIHTYTDINTHKHTAPFCTWRYGFLPRCSSCPTAFFARAVTWRRCPQHERLYPLRKSLLQGGRRRGEAGSGWQQRCGKRLLLAPGHKVLACQEALAQLLWCVCVSLFVCLFMCVYSYVYVRMSVCRGGRGGM